MGQKVHPVSLRLQLNKNWKSKWVANSRIFPKQLAEDNKIRAVIEKRFENQAVIAGVTIERSHNLNTVNILTAKPGLVIGKSGAGIEEIKKDLFKILGKKEVRINIEEVKRPELNAKLVGESVARQLKARAAFRRVMKMTVAATMRAGAKGCKIQISGRLGGVEMARTEYHAEGTVPLSTMRMDIDYCLTVYNSPDGLIGIKVWINKGEA